MTPAKRELLEKQIASKISWGATEQEIVEWLLEKHGIPGDQAGAIYSAAVKLTVKEVRGDATIALVFYGIGVLMFAGFLIVQWKGGFVLVGIPVVIVYTIGIAAVGAFLKNIALLFIREKDFGQPELDSSDDESADSDRN